MVTNAHSVTIKLVVFSLFVNLVFGLLAYFGVFSGNNTNTAITVFNTFQSTLTQTVNQLSQNINNGVSNQCSLIIGSCSVLGSYLGAGWNILTLLVVGLLMIAYMFFVFVPLLINFTLGGALGTVLALIDFSITIISVIYVTFTIKEMV